MLIRKKLDGAFLNIILDVENVTLVHGIDALRPAMAAMQSKSKASHQLLLCLPSGPDATVNKPLLLVQRMAYGCIYVYSI